VSTYSTLDLIVAYMKWGQTRRTNLWLSALLTAIRVIKQDWDHSNAPVSVTKDWSFSLQLYLDIIYESFIISWHAKINKLL